MPHLSNKGGIFEVTTTQRAGYAQVNTFNLRLYQFCCYDLEVTMQDSTKKKILNIFIDLNTFICPQ